MRAGARNDTIFIGDMNLNFFEWNDLSGTQRRMAELTEDTIVVEGFTQVINKPTHITRNKESLLDQCWVNCPRRLNSHFVNNQGFSDHHLIGVILNGKLKTKTPEHTLKRSWKHYSKSLLLFGLGNCDWSAL